MPGANLWPIFKRKAESRLFFAEKNCKAEVLRNVAIQFGMDSFRRTWEASPAALFQEVKRGFAGLVQ